MLNSLNKTRTMVADFSEIPQLKANGSYNVVNAWTGEDLGCKENEVSMMLDEHDTAVLAIGDSC